MSRALRIQGAQYPFDTRFKAREIYLRGRSLAQVSEELGEDADKKAAEAATAAGLPAPPPSPRVPQTVISYWSRKGSWASHRGVAERFVEREQLKRIRKELAIKLRNNGNMLSFLQGFLQQYFHTEKRNEKGEVILDENRKPIMVPRGPGDWAIDDPTKAIASMLSIFDKDVAYVKLISEMLGEALPKIDPNEVSFTAPRSTRVATTIEKEESK
jgi:hypothetical protein